MSGRSELIPMTHEQIDLHMHVQLLLLIGERVCAWLKIRFVLIKCITLLVPGTDETTPLLIGLGT